MFFSHCFALHSAFQKKFDLTSPKAGNTFCKKKNWKDTFDRNLMQVSMHLSRWSKVVIIYLQDLEAKAPF